MAKKKKQKWFFFVFLIGINVFSHINLVRFVTNVVFIIGLTSERLFRNYEKYKDEIRIFVKHIYYLGIFSFSYLIKNGQLSQ